MFSVLSFCFIKIPSVPQIMRYNKFNYFDSVSWRDVGNKKVTFRKLLIININISDHFNVSFILMSLKIIRIL